MKPEFWNERYQQSEYVYGVEPNIFFKEQLDLITPGKILLPADGEGRNSVYAAMKGWEVDAFDYADAGRQKALQLAEKHAVSINYTVTDYLSFETKSKYDVIGLFYTHTDNETKRKFLERLADHLKPGGRMIMEAFSKQQLGKPSGGPKNLELLYSADELKKYFSSLNITYIEELKTELSEGAYHVGPANVVRMVAVKNE